MRATSQKVNSVLVIDVGGTHVKVLATGQREERRIPSGSKMTAAKMVRDVKRLAKGWQYDCASIGYPGPVIHGHPVHESYNAAMQALGSYEGGDALFGPRRGARDGHDR
jgi:polyphosphate glucokinase